jgi:hypothetical protein
MVATWIAIGANSGLEVPSLDCFDSFLVKSVAEASHYLEVCRMTVRFNHARQYNGSLNLRVACLCRIMRDWTLDTAWVADTTSAGAERADIASPARSGN